MSAFHCADQPGDLLAVLQRRHQLAVVDVEHLGGDAKPGGLLDFRRSPLGQRSAGHPPVADVAVGDRDELDVVAQRGPLGGRAADLNSQSSGWAPKAMIRSLPSVFLGIRGCGLGHRQQVETSGHHRRHEQSATSNRRNRNGSSSGLLHQNRVQPKEKVLPTDQYQRLRRTDWL